ncbi:hypothetical protein EOD41_04955 [Mucilaginibacter limnophilus]|uniref:Uncharacterized protein n=1 Tax=Mucilaginibacter limnophilus TaxID=1932778 RepID=A0A437MUM4_9SPHI|nr:hypothetical protein [Mucilaginibacter limnophilus]RVU01316.1 hypothetical protein EOD41_04955 [Mucilaginibacter limnophilus]
MKNDMYIKVIDESWGENGFLGKLRDGVFDRNLFNELYASILKLHYKEGEIIPRNVIGILWFIPTFMYRQKEYLNDTDKNAFDEMREHIEDAIAGILGYP